MNGNGARPDVWTADLEAPRARILELEREVAALAEANAAHVEAHALMAARLARTQENHAAALARATDLEARVATVRAIARRQERALIPTLTPREILAAIDRKHP